MDQSNLEPARSYLRHVRNRITESDAPTIELLESIRERAVAAGHQELAQSTWCLLRTLEVQNRYLQAFDQLKAKQHYEAWHSLERVEIGLLFLGRHQPVDTDEYMLAFIDRHARQLQKLFPYRLFTSPGFLERESICSICEKRISLRAPCGHIVGDIYDGRMCNKIVKDLELLEVSLVEKPVMKSNVIFLSDPETGEQRDQHDYSLIDYIMRGLRGPFDAWTLHETTRREPHKLYKHIGRNAPCPCRSKKRYKACCLREEGVVVPHLEVQFHVPPPEDMPPFMMSK